MNQIVSATTSFQLGAAFSHERNEAISRHRALESALKPWCTEMQDQATRSGLKLTYQIKINEAVDPDDVCVEVSLTRGRWWKETSTLKIRQRKEGDRGNYDYFINCYPYKQQGFPANAGFRRDPDIGDNNVRDLQQKLEDLVYKKLIATEEFLRLEGARRVPTLS